jgi:hypothetical protein
MSDDEKTLRVFKNTWFRRFARRERITDESLREAVAGAEKGAIEGYYPDCCAHVR